MPNTQKKKTINNLLTDNRKNIYDYSVILVFSYYIYKYNVILILYCILVFYLNGKWFYNILCILCVNEYNTGFLPEKVCTDHMVSFVDNLALGIQVKLRTDVIYFDFAKAFDSVNHYAFVNKIKYQYNVDGTPLHFLKSYLQNRKQRVIIELNLI